MGRARPTGPYANEMTGPGAWPDTDETVYTNRAADLGRTLTSVTESLTTWQQHQAAIFNGVHVWSGDASKAASGAVEGATKALAAARAAITPHWPKQLKEDDGHLWAISYLLLEEADRLLAGSTSGATGK